MFSDKEIDKKVKYRLGIFDDTEPKEKDLDKIKEIFISNLNMRGEVINTDLSDLVKLRRLRILNLKGFELNDEVMSIIQNFSEIRCLNFYSCYLKKPISINIETLKKLVFDNCKSINFSNIHMPEILLIVNGGIVDISKFLHIERLKDLQINNSEIVNSTNLEMFDSLKSLKIDGSTLDNENILGRLSNKNVSVSYEAEYYQLI